MTRKLATVSRLPSGRGRDRPKTRLASAVDGSERPAQVRSVRGCLPGVHVHAGHATPALITAQQRKESGIDAKPKPVDQA